MVLKEKSLIKEYLYRLGPDIIKKINQAGKLADLGCGQGQLLELLHQEFAKDKENLYGFDLSLDFINETKKSFNNVFCLDLDEKKLPFQDFDVIFALDIIEHLEFPLKFLQNAALATRPNGLIIISTPNTRSLSYLLQGKNWYAFKDETHKHFYNRKQLTELLGKTGFKIVNSKTISSTKYPFYNKIISILGWGGQILLAAEKTE